MSIKLSDPNLPAGEVVKTYADGSALRNDGEQLTPANKNPWYVLATVYGEQDGVRRNLGLHVGNRRIWNGWLCGKLASSRRAKLAKELELNADDLAPLSEAETDLLFTHFAEAFPGKDVQNLIPKPGEVIDLSNVYCERMLDFKQCMLSGDTNFQKAHFVRSVDFKSTYFAGPAEFGAAYFAGPVNFEAAHFTGPVNFNAVQFAGSVNFAAAHIDWHANFETAHFTEYADFSTAHFAERAQFSDGVFNAATNFQGAIFKTSVPEFYQREMHQDTRFTTTKAHWPRVTKENAEQGKQAYTRLRQISSQNHNPDDEHFFLRQEMRCKEVLADRFHGLMFWLYRGVSDCGYSVARPVLGLLAIVVIIWPVIGSWLRHGAAPEGQAVLSAHPIAEALGISVGNTLPFLNLVRKMHPNFYAEAPAWLDALSGVQSVAGIVLLFFLGLGLRNRFRLK